VSTGAVDVGAIEIVGLTTMRRADFADIVEHYIGRTLSAADLAALADQLAGRARARYPLATATIEPQTITAGVLRVRIDEGTIDEVRVEGSDTPAIRAALAPLVDGAPVTSAALERRLLIAGDIDGVTIGKAKVVREDDRNILVVPTSYEHVRAQVTLDNDSTKPLGPLELYGNLRVNGVLSSDDTLQLFALDTVPELDELAFGRVRYGKRIGTDGSEVSLTASYSHSAPGAYLEPYDIEGESWLAGASVLHPLLRRQQQSLWLEGSINYREVRQSQADRLLREDKLTVAQFGVYGYGRLAGGTLRVSSTLSQGLDLLDATQSGDPFASRDDADATFTALNMFADWTHAIAGPVSVKFAVRSQLAAQPLLVSEEIGLGGAAFVRGYDYSERSGDQGAMASAELQYDWDRRFGFARGAKLYAFVDGGRVTNLEDGYGSGSLFSTGGGIRADVDAHTDASLEIAVPLSGPRYDTGNADPKVRFSLTRYF